MIPSDQRVPANAVTEDNGGPLIVAGNRKATGKPPRRKVHLIRPMNKRSVCGWSYAADQVDIFEDETEWATEYTNFRECKWCFRLYSLPQDWTNTPLDIATTETMVNKDEKEPDLTDEEVPALAGYSDDTTIVSETDDDTDAKPLPIVQMDTPGTVTPPAEPTAGEEPRSDSTIYVNLTP